MWLWTLSSIAKGEGVPFCQSCALQGPSGSGPWLQQVMNPFAKWSNSSEFVVQGAYEGVRQTKPFQVCTNLGFPNSGVRALPAIAKVEGVPVDSTWPVDFKTELSLALFGLVMPPPLPPDDALTSVKVVEAQNSYELSDPGRPSGRVSFRPPAADVQAVRSADSGGGARAGVVPGEQDSGGAVSPAQGHEGEPPGVPKDSKAPARDKRPGGKRQEAERERWRRHIAAHHARFRKDCLQCVTSGALGLQHRRVKRFSMYALAFDLTGPFKEPG